MRYAIGVEPVTQRIEGWPYGECVRASYAAHLGLPIESVPRFDPASLRPGEEQLDRERAWLSGLRLPAAPNGFDLFDWSVPPEEELPREIIDRAPPREHLISGISPRGFGHRCVGWGGRVLWDPHPSRDGLATVFSLLFVVPR